MGEPKDKRKRERDEERDERDRRDGRKKERRDKERDAERKAEKKEKKDKRDKKEKRDKKDADKPRGKDEPPARLFPPDPVLDAPPPGGFAVAELTPADYYSKNHEFSYWLQTERWTYFTSLEAPAARKLFLEFCSLWNARRLPRRLYDGVTLQGRR